MNTLREAIPEYAKDLNLNLGSVLTPQGAPGLTGKQIWSVAVATAIASRNTAFTREIEALAVSAVNGCGLCIASHEKKLRAHGVTREAIQSAVRIGAVIHAVAVVLEGVQS